MESGPKRAEAARYERRKKGLTIDFLVIVILGRSPFKKLGQIVQAHLTCNKKEERKTLVTAAHSLYL